MLTIVSYNTLNYGQNAQDARRREQQHELLRAEQPDIVCLQEIWDERADLAGLHRHVGTLGEALGMSALAVPAPQTSCHLAILWRPDFTAISQQTHGWALLSGLGVVELDVGAAVPLRVATTHLSPWDGEERLSHARTVAGLLGDPAQATVVIADWNSLGDTDYDPEPDFSLLRPDMVWHHVRWDDDPDAPLRADRRPAELMRRSGFADAAHHLEAPWQATGGHMGQDMPRRLDVFWTTRPQALRGYRVVDSPTARELSDHLPIRVDIDPDALAPAQTPG